jgi:hypothetical protein
MHIKMSMQERLQLRIIDRLIELHKLNMNRVNFDVQDRKQAIYFLQGGAITCAINARKLTNEVGILGREWRFISEIAYVIEYFDELNDRSREITAWFTKDAIIDRKPSKKTVDSSLRQQKTGLPEDHFRQFDDSHKSLLRELSKFAHPSFPSVRANSTTITHQFDYYQTYDDDPGQREALRGIFISEAINCFLGPSKSLPLNSDQFSELLNYKISLNTKLF